MAFTHKNNSGSLFKNDRKESDKHPDYTGTIIIDGVAYWLSAWIKDGQKGKFMSLAAKPKDEKFAEKKQASAPAQRRSAREDMDDEIPF